jgi:hypothetical protein
MKLLVLSIPCMGYVNFSLSARQKNSQCWRCVLATVMEAAPINLGVEPPAAFGAQRIWIWPHDLLI